MPPKKLPHMMYVVWVKAEDDKLYIRHCADTEQSALRALEEYLQLGFTAVSSQYMLSSDTQELSTVQQ